MAELPRLTTERLALRPFAVADASEVERLAGDREVAAGLLHLPHPYPPGAALAWITTHAPTFEAEQSVTLAIDRLSPPALIGAVALRVEREHDRAALGYWVGRPYWGNGYATEAARALMHWAFDELGLNRIYAHHFATNPASGRVLQKAGMRHEGVQRQHTRKWNRYVDREAYGLLRSEWERREAPGAR